MDLSNAVWRKAKRSGENGGACVEVASALGGAAIRDSKDPYGPKLIVDRSDFRRFAEMLKRL
ncbi:hypothetical protein GCM10010182_77760 [Actinomadura cremea]|nr:hypothetical protein GCM10010182_77760 [Actinomadura cremea]